jgi:carboxyl-terminal processing protease
MQVAFCVPGWKGGPRSLIVASLLCLAVAACASRGPFPPQLISEQRADIVEVLSDAYRQASENYVERVSVGDLALAGLKGVSRMHTPMSVQDDRETITVRFFTGEPPLLTRLRPPDDDIDGWSSLVADALIAVTSRAGTPPVPSGRIFQIHMEGLAEAMGPEVEYISDRDFRDILFGKFDSGISFEFRKTAAGVEVLDLDPYGHLEAEGLRRGDIVTAVSSVDIHQLKPARFARLLWGQEGTQVTLSVLRGDPPQPTAMQFTRWKQVALTYQMVRQGGILVFKVPDLNGRAVRELSTALVQQKSMTRYGGQPVTGALLDLRGSVGSGVFATDVLANVFLGKGVISIERGSDADSERVTRASWPDSSDGMPLVVLVDGRTGSGASVLAAALQDNGRALVVGSSTFLDGLVAKNVSLYNMGVLRMPVAHLIAPSGYALGGRGVMPDVCVAQDNANKAAWLSKLRRGEGLIKLTDRTRQVDAGDDAALSAHRALCPLAPDPRSFDPTMPSTTGKDLAEGLALAILNDPHLYTSLLRPSPGAKPR